MCSQCEKSFSFAQHLREHNYRHQGLRPYICGISGCTEIFRHSSEFSLHRRIHPEYRLKKYQYTETFTYPKKSGKGAKKKYESISEVKTNDVNIESPQYNRNEGESRNERKDLRIFGGVYS